VFVSASLAYIDPVSGTILLQLIIAGVIGVVGFFRRAILGTIRRLVGIKSATEDSGTPDEPKACDPQP